MSLVADHIALGIQRKLAEQSLRQKQERLTLALQAGRMGVYDWDMVTDALWWSPETYTSIRRLPGRVCSDSQRL